MRDIKDYSLKEHNTFGIDAKCSRFLEYESVDEAMEVAKILPLPENLRRQNILLRRAPH